MVVWQALQVHRTCSHCGGVPHPADEVTPKAHPTPWTTVRARGHSYYRGCPGDSPGHSPLGYSFGGTTAWSYLDAYPPIGPLRASSMVHVNLQLPEELWSLVRSMVRQLPQIRRI